MAGWFCLRVSHEVTVGFLLRWQLPTGLAGNGGSTSKVAHTCGKLVLGCWPRASVPACVGLSIGPQESPPGMEAGLLQSKLSKDQSRSCNALLT